MLKHLRLKSLKTILYYGLAFLLIFLGLIGLWQRYDSTHTSKPIYVPNVASSDQAVSEKPINIKSTNYQVPADMPRTINLPTINAQGFVQKVGLTKDNSIATPNNINLAGWYSGSVKPGDNGLSIIVGHVHGVYASGIFVNLLKLAPGAIYSVSFGDNSIRKFQVVRVISVPLASASNVLLNHDNSIKSQLNLITCNGTYDKNTKLYDQRLIVISKRV